MDASSLEFLETISGSSILTASDLRLRRTPVTSPEACRSPERPRRHEFGEFEGGGDGGAAEEERDAGPHLKVGRPRPPQKRACGASKNVYCLPSGGQASACPVFRAQRLAPGPAG